ncbi:hypothetical protein EN873_08460 [bacterium M00.F.Ca.ET.230.01.1.1]|nr:hypothetical protein EN873_08460 [bacterium M00.F.Ca.ET.230.01.1.1]
MRHLFGVPSGTPGHFDGVALLVSGKNRHPGMVQGRVAKLGQMRKLRPSRVEIQVRLSRKWWIPRTGAERT